MPTATTKRSQTKNQAPPPVPIRLTVDPETKEALKKVLIFDWELPKTHELIIDAVADMLHSGGRTEDVDALIIAAMSHVRRRWMVGIGPKAPETGSDALEFIRQEFNEWKAELVVGWKRNKWPEGAPRFEPKTITEVIRFNVRARAEGVFREFMSHASPEELALMAEVLATRESQSFPSWSKSDEIFLATAFDDVVERRGQKSYIKVPGHLVDQVEKYIDALRAIEDKAALDGR